MLSALILPTATSDTIPEGCTVTLFSAEAHMLTYKVESEAEMRIYSTHSLARGNTAGKLGDD
jgi:hypothetical protein